MSSEHMLRSVALFAGLSDEALAEIAALLGRRTYAKGLILFHQGSPGGALHIITAGRVRVFLLSDAGQEMSLNICGPGQVLGELSLLDGQPHSAGALALEPTITQTLGRDDFLNLLDRHPLLARNAIEILAQRLRHATTYAERVFFLDVPGRVAAKLLELSAWAGAPGAPGAQLALSQAELATWVGAARETVNRVLGELASQGLVRLSEQQITILDRAGLQRKVRF